MATVRQWLYQRFRWIVGIPLLLVLLGIGVQALAGIGDGDSYVLQCAGWVAYLIAMVGLIESGKDARDRRTSRRDRRRSEGRNDGRGNDGRRGRERGNGAQRDRTRRDSAQRDGARNGHRGRRTDAPVAEEQTEARPRGSKPSRRRSGDPA
ncbi:MAG: hypothetical protein JXA67_18040 [Micromonosporaceae bacterium]|nr:hypothetical protein [Micromonosporaceae bacterium]